MTPNNHHHLSESDILVSTVANGDKHQNNTVSIESLTSNKLSPSNGAGEKNNVENGDTKIHKVQTNIYVLKKTV